MTDSKIKKIISFIKGGDLVSSNDSYNKEVLGFSSLEHNEVVEIISDIYGQRFNWPARIPLTEIKKRLRRE